MNGVTQIAMPVAWCSERTAAGKPPVTIQPAQTICSRPSRRRGRQSRSGAARRACGTANGSPTRCSTSRYARMRCVSCTCCATAAERSGAAQREARAGDGGVGHLRGERAHDDRRAARGRRRRVAPRTALRRCRGPGTRARRGADAAARARPSRRASRSMRPRRALCTTVAPGRVPRNHGHRAEHRGEHAEAEREAPRSAARPPRRRRRGRPCAGGTPARASRRRAATSDAQQPVRPLDDEVRVVDRREPVLRPVGDLALRPRSPQPIPEPEMRTIGAEDDVHDATTSAARAARRTAIRPPRRGRAQARARSATSDLGDDGRGGARGHRAPGAWRAT